MDWKFWENWFKPSDNENAFIDELVSKTDETESDRTAAKVPTIYITENLLERTRQLLASFADNTPSEGVVYWFGFECDEAAIVSTLVVPDADTRWGCIRTTPQVNAQALSVIIGTPLILLGQAHSHPGSIVRHSETDDKETFASFDGSISVVVPNFGREGINLKTCGIHRHLHGEFRFIETSEISNHINVVPGEADFRTKSKAKQLEE